MRLKQSAHLFLGIYRMAKPVTDQQILDAALQTIIEHGYSGATTRQIAEAAGVNEVTLFRRFGSKKNILLASVETQAQQFAEEGVRYTGDLVADLTRIVSSHRRFAENRGKLFPMIMAELPRQPELAEVLEKPFANMLQIIEIIERYQHAGELVDEDPAHLLASLLGPMILTEMFLEVHKTDIITPIDIETHIRSFLEGRRVKSLAHAS